MPISIARRIRGNLYGSIDISVLEDRVVAHPIVQRLRRVKQTSFLSYVFPGASHTRFEHSLGVLHLSTMAWRRLRENHMRLEQTCMAYPHFALRELEVTLVHGILDHTFHGHMDPIYASDSIAQSLRLAALLHDVGHPPFSHSGELFLPQVQALLRDMPTMPSYLVQAFQDTLTNDPEKYASHEMLSAILIHQLLEEVYAEGDYGDLRIPPQDVIAILNPRIPASPQSDLHTLGVTQLCHELVSSELDIDRMDYLMRDSKECGIVYGYFDVERILDSLCVYTDPQDRKLHLAIRYAGLAAFEDYLRARQSMYVQLYFHKSSVAAEAMLHNIQRLIQPWSLPSTWQAYIEIDDYNIKDIIQKYATQTLSLTEQAALDSLLKDLLLHRRLWKRVYEVTSHHPAQDQDLMDTSMQSAESTLNQAGIPYERVNSSNALTKMQKRHQDQPSVNRLKLIKMDSKQFPRVLPIEDYSRLIYADSIIKIDRLYVPPFFASQAKQLLRL